LRRPVVGLGIETAIDGAGPFGAALVGFSGGGENVIAHLRAEVPGLPAESLRVETRHALAVFGRHFEMNDGIALHDLLLLLMVMLVNAWERKMAIPTSRYAIID